MQLYNLTIFLAKMFLNMYSHNTFPSQVIIDYNKVKCKVEKWKEEGH